MKVEFVRRCLADQFTQIPNTLIRDTSISIKARGVLVYLLSHSGVWDHFRSKVMKDCGLGQAAYYSAMDELENAGYIIRKKGGFPARTKLYRTDYKGGLENEMLDSSEHSVSSNSGNREVRENGTHKNNNPFKNKKNTGSPKNGDSGQKQNQQQKAIKYRELPDDITLIANMYQKRFGEPMSQKIVGLPATKSAYMERQDRWLQGDTKTSQQKEKEALAAMAAISAGAAANY